MKKLTNIEASEYRRQLEGAIASRDIVAPANATMDTTVQIAISISYSLPPSAKKRPSLMNQNPIPNANPSYTTQPELPMRKPSIHMFTPLSSRPSNIDGAYSQLHRGLTSVESVRHMNTPTDATPVPDDEYIAYNQRAVRSLDDLL